MTPTSPAGRPPRTPKTSAGRPAEDETMARAAQIIAERQGVDPNDVVPTTFRIPNQMRTRLGLAVIAEPNYNSMTDIFLEALDDWLGRHGYPAP